MSLLINLRQLEKQNVHLDGQISVSDLNLDFQDELVHLEGPLSYDLDVEKLDKGVLVQGTLKLPINCECARCLKPFRQEIYLDSWASHLTSEGEDAMAVVNDCVDLTPYIREDILLSFPQHPLCEPECSGLTSPRSDRANGGEKEKTSSAWAELNKLKFDK